MSPEEYQQLWKTKNTLKRSIRDPASAASVAVDFTEQARQLVTRHRQGRTHQPTYCCPEDEPFYERRLAEDIASLASEAATAALEQERKRIQRKLQSLPTSLFGAISKSDAIAAIGDDKDEHGN